MSKSQRRIIHNPSVSVSLTDELDPNIRFFVKDYSNPSKAVAFEISLYAWKHLKRENAKLCRVAADRVARTWNDWNNEAEPAPKSAP